MAKLRELSNNSVFKAWEFILPINGLSNLTFYLQSFISNCHAWRGENLRSILNLLEFKEHQYKFYNGQNSKCVMAKIQILYNHNGFSEAFMVGQNHSILDVALIRKRMRTKFVVFPSFLLYVIYALQRNHVFSI